MSGLGGPTVLIPVGPIGELAVQRVEATLGARDPSLRVHRMADAAERLGADLQDLLRVGRVGEPRLDVFVFVDLTGPTDPTELLRAPCARVSEVVGGTLGRVFPADVPPEHRTAALHVVGFCPPMVVGAGIERVLDGLSALLAWSAEAPHPTLARIWLAAAQTSAGVLGPDELASQGAGFALGLLGSGARDTDVVRARLAHPRAGEGPVGMIAVGTLDVPLGRIEAWARVSAAWTAVERILERTAADPGASPHPALPPARLDAWLAPFTDGPLVERVKAEAWKASGGRVLPDRVHVEAADTSASVRERYPALFDRSVVDADPDEPALRDALDALEARRAEVVAELHGAVDAPLRSRLGEPRPLADLPQFEASLEQLRRRLDVAEPPAVDAVTTDASEGLGPLEDALAALPDGGVRRMVGAGAGLAAAFVAVAVGAALVLRAPSVPAGGPGPSTTIVSLGAPVAEPVRAAQLAPWGLGLVFGGVVAAGVSSVVGRGARSDAERALEARLQVLVRNRDRGGGPRGAVLARQRIELHRTRIRRAARGAVESAQARLRAARSAWLACRDALATRLDGLGVRPGAGDADLDGLLQGETALHARLVGADAVRGWVRRARRYADTNALADALLDGSFGDDGLLLDVPASDPERVIALADAQIAALGSTSLFDDEGAATDARDRVERFAQTVATALAPGNVPRGADGAPARGVRPGELVTVGPTDGRSALEPALVRAPVAIVERVWTSAPVPMVLFVRTWEGWSVDDVRRGCGGPRA